MQKKLGPYSASIELFEFIFKNVPFGSTVLELGSGEGTALLGEHYEVYSIEHDKRFIGLVDNTTYIHAPIKPCKHPSFPHHTHWYDSGIIRRAIKDLDYDVLLVDGPNGAIGRSGFLTHLDLFKLENAMIIFDDVNRYDELTIFMEFMMLNFDKPHTVAAILPGTDQKRFGVVTLDEAGHSAFQMPRPKR